MKGSSRVSILQGKEKRCFATIESGIALHKHHIFYGSGHRKISDKYGLWVWLKPEKHNIGRESLHMRPGHGLDLELKQRAQRAFEAEYGHEEFMKVIGRNYLETHEEQRKVETHEEQEELPQVRTQLVETHSTEPMAIAKYTLAVKRMSKGNGEVEADFVRCVAFGKSAEFAEKYFKKGQLIAIAGRLQVRSWEGEDGKRRWGTDVVVEEQHFAEGR